MSGAGGAAGGMMAPPIDTSGYQSHQMVIAISSVFMVLALIFVVLRVIARTTKGATKFGVDDGLAVASFITFVLFTYAPTMYMANVWGLGDHVTFTPEGPIEPGYGFNVALQIIQCCHVIPLTLIKLSILFFYRRIFQGKAFDIVSITTIAFVLVWGVSFFFSTLFQCTPITLSLQEMPGAPNLTCINEKANFYALSITDFLFDIVILIIPIPFVWRLQMSVKSKIGVSLIFILGGLTIGASCARFAVFVNAGNLLAEMDPDVTYYVAPTAWVVVLETSLAICCASLPMMKSLFTRGTFSNYVRSALDRISLRSMRSREQASQKPLQEPNFSYGNTHGSSAHSVDKKGFTHSQDADTDETKNGIVVSRRFETSNDPAYV